MLHHVPNQIDYGKKNAELNSGTAIFSIFFSDIIITLEKINTFSWSDCEQWRILNKFTLDKNQKVNLHITSQVYIENFFHTLFCSSCVSLVSALQQMYYSRERVQELQKDGVLCDNCEQLKAVNYYHKALCLNYDRVPFLLFNLRTISTTKRGNWQKINIKFSWFLQF